MEKIKTIRLYRYNIGITEENDCTEYMTMDYFDSFDVEEEEDIISGCIGNGEKYSYLAMQEMCFKCDEIFRMPDGEKSFFTLIQIFVNPDFIYSDQEDEDDKVSYILKKYIDKFVAYVQEKCKVDYQVFPLITAGDYLVCIRSNDIHVAYDISTVLRDLYFEMGQKRCLLFTTYSILGMKNDIILTDEKLQQLHINEKDLVSIRGIFSDRYREADLEMNPSIDREEYQLYGRYDQTVDIPLHDYLQMQNFLVLYKKGKFNEAAECIECFMSKEYQDIKSKELLEKISKGYFSYWNERILLYKRDDFSEFRTNKEQFCVANLPQRKFLKQINTELYIECEELLRDIKEHQTMWERERINTYYNLLERLLEISKNLNYQRELRIHVAILLKDGKYLVVQKDAAASAVADIVAPELADAIIEYNHHLLKGDLKSKKLILKQIADALEPRRAELKTVNKTIENDFFYMINTMNVRHNNCDVSDPSKYNEKFANLTDREKEEWYDEIYQEGLMAYLSLEQVDREKKILDFKTKQKK